MSANVSIEEVARVAELANLELTPDESAHMQKDLNAILDYIAQLNELDTHGVAPLAQASELAGVDARGSLRADERRPSLERAAVMAQTPVSDEVFFKVPKVIER